MPIYEYKCGVCRKETEVIHRKHAEPPPPCPKDEEHGAMDKKISRSSFHLKGGGWASSGYAG